MKELTRNNSICPPPEALLFESLKKNDVESIKALINSNPELINYVDPITGKTFLVRACELEEVEVCTIETLIEHGADVIGDEEWKPLHIAAFNFNTQILQTILKNLRPGHINDTVDGNTALLALVKSEKIKETESVFCENVKELLRAGIDVNKTDSKNLTAIFWAAKKGYKNIVKTILENSIAHVDLDNHKLRNQNARNIILEKKLYEKALPEPILRVTPKEKLLSLIKQGKEEDFIAYFDTLSLTVPSDFVNLDDESSTLLQYCCKKGLTKIANYLIQRNADINKTISNNTKTPLEIAASNGYYELLELLIKEPGVKISSNLFCNLLKDSDNSKFDKIDYEKCCQIVLDKLKTDKTLMDINESDESSNTCIHYSLRYCNEATTEELLKLGASLACKNRYGFMPIEDIKPDLLQKHLDNCIEFNIKEDNLEKENFEVVFNYENLLTPQKSTDLENNTSKIVLQPETEVISYMSRTPEFQSLLKHPLIVSFLFMKWHNICWLFYTNLLFYVLFVASLLSYTFSYYIDAELSETCDGFCKLASFGLNLTFWVLVIRELFQITVSSTKYFKNFENYVEIILIGLSAVILYGDSSFDVRKQLASLAILLSAFELVLMLGQHPKFSTNVVMLKTVSFNFFTFLLWYSLLIIAFALSFYILFAKPQIVATLNGTDSDANDSFMGPGKSLFKTIVMLTGEFDASSIDFYTYPITSKIIFSLFVFMITIILLNLLNGLAVSDTQTIKNDAELVGHIARAQHIYYVECMLHGNIVPTGLLEILQKIFCCCPSTSTTCTFLRPLARRICLFTDPSNSKLTVLPNKHRRIFYESNLLKKRRKNAFSCSNTCKNTYLDKETVKRINAIVKLRRDKLLYSTEQNFEKLHAEIIDLRAKLDDIINMLKQNHNCVP